MSEIFTPKIVSNAPTQVAPSQNTSFAQQPQPQEQLQEQQQPQSKEPYVIAEKGGLKLWSDQRISGLTASTRFVEKIDALGRITRTKVAYEPERVTREELTSLGRSASTFDKAYLKLSQGLSDFEAQNIADASREAEKLASGVSPEKFEKSNSYKIAQMRESFARMYAEKGTTIPEGAKEQLEQAQQQRILQSSPEMFELVARTPTKLTYKYTGEDAYTRPQPAIGLSLEEQNKLIAQGRQADIQAIYSQYNYQVPLKVIEEKYEQFRSNAPGYEKDVIRKLPTLMATGKAFIPALGGDVYLSVPEQSEEQLTSQPLSYSDFDIVEVTTPKGTERMTVFMYEKIKDTYNFDTSNLVNTSAIYPQSPEQIVSQALKSGELKIKIPFVGSGLDVSKIDIVQKQSAKPTPTSVYFGTPKQTFIPVLSAREGKTIGVSYSVLTPQGTVSSIDTPESGFSKTPIIIEKTKVIGDVLVEAEQQKFIPALDAYSERSNEMFKAFDLPVVKEAFGALDTTSKFLSARAEQVATEQEKAYPGVAGQISGAVVKYPALFASGIAEFPKWALTSAGEGVNIATSGIASGAFYLAAKNPIVRILAPNVSQRAKDVSLKLAEQTKEGVISKGPDVAMLGLSLYGGQVIGAGSKVVKAIPASSTKVITRLGGESLLETGAYAISKIPAPVRDVAGKAIKILGSTVEPALLGVAGYSVLENPRESGKFFAPTVIGMLPLKIGEVKILTTATEASLAPVKRTIYRGVYFQLGDEGIARPLLGIGEKGVIFGSKFDASKQFPSLTKAYFPTQVRKNIETYPKSPLQTSVLTDESVLKQLGASADDITKIRTQMEITRQLSSTESAFISDFPKETKGLTQQQTKIVRDWAAQGQKKGLVGRLYGSYTSSAQTAPGLTRTPNDIELPLYTTPEKALVELEVLAAQLSKTGTKFKVGSEKNPFEVYSSKGTALDGKVKGVQSEADLVKFVDESKGFRYGMKEDRASIFIKGFEVQPLSEQVIRKGATATTWWRESISGAFIVEPPAHRIKDVADFYSYSKSLVLSQRTPNKKLLTELEEFINLEWRTPGLKEQFAKIQDNPFATSKVELSVTPPTVPPSQIVTKTIPSVVASAQPKFTAKTLGDYSSPASVSPSISPSSSRSVIVSPSSSVIVSPSSSVIVSPSRSPSPSHSPSSSSFSGPPRIRRAPPSSPSSSSFSGPPRIRRAPPRSPSSSSFSPPPPSLRKKEPPLEPPFPRIRRAPPRSPSSSWFSPPPPSLIKKEPPFPRIRRGPPSSPSSSSFSPPPPSLRKKEPPLEPPFYPGGSPFPLMAKKTQMRSRSFNLKNPQVTGSRSIYADLISVMGSQLKYGKATSASLVRRPGVWKYAQNVAGFVPTAEQLNSMRRKR